MWLNHENPKTFTMERNKMRDEENENPETIEENGSLLGHPFSDTTLPNPDSIHRIGCFGATSRMRPLVSHRWSAVGRLRNHHPWRSYVRMPLQRSRVQTPDP